MSWAVPKGPSLDPRTAPRGAHREPPVRLWLVRRRDPPGQYGAGEVIVWDCGVYSPDDDQEYWFHDREEAERRVREGMERESSASCCAREDQGSFALVRTRDAKNWLLTSTRTASRPRST